MLKIVFLVCVTVVLLTVLKQTQTEFALFLKFSVLAVICLLIIRMVQQSTDSFSEIFTLANINVSYFTVMLKMLGLCITAQITENICKDCGENALASTVEIAAKCSILLVALPIAKELVTICLGWLQ